MEAVRHCAVVAAATGAGAPGEGPIRRRDVEDCGQWRPGSCAPATTVRGSAGMVEKHAVVPGLIAGDMAGRFDAAPVSWLVSQMAV